MEERQKSAAKFAAAVVVVGAMAFWWTQSSPIRSSEKSSYGKECEQWIAKRFADGERTRITDSWRKRGSPVFEIAVYDADKSYYSTYLCVVDKKKGTMKKPSVFDQSWKK
ncbi:hypothetical protein PE067_09430 [Paracoccus sp. DMF-8]|uniref:hypothetical protein n=1 Tax=Paracoccus sp. DMF-8 TaxID=3019445 RepID=UPI0023E8464B|nr:hypothetical protein [Paracoccus sp. DMF-8]MDF3606340.1 hypothetical protein [Paracoccus sp. DMF-8]